MIQFRSSTPPLTAHPPLFLGARSASATPSTPLSIDLIPSTAWGSNVRSRYPGQWDDFRRACYRAAGNRCEVCGATGRMECHEVWTYRTPPMQHLERLICLCSLCHSAQHYGYSAVRGITEEVDAHIRKVNGWSKRQLDAHIQKAFKIWDARNRVQWVTETALLDVAAAGLALRS